MSIKSKIEKTGMSYKELEKASKREVKAGTWGYIYREQLIAISDRMQAKAAEWIDKILKSKKEKYARNRNKPIG